MLQMSEVTNDKQYILLERAKALKLHGLWRIGMNRNTTMDCAINLMGRR